MKLEDEHFKEMLFNIARERNIDLTDQKLQKMLMFKNELIEYNKKINLTAITDDEDIIYKHFIDSLETIKYINERSSLIDIGSGAGFPGVVIAIYFDNKASVTLLDSLTKRTEFLKYIVEKLELKNVDIINGRAEELSQEKQYRERFDYSTARAVANLNILLEYSIPFLRVGGKALLLKSKNKGEEIEQAKNALEELSCRITGVYEFNYCLNNEKFDRNIIDITKNKKTAEKYPRNYGRIKKCPL